MARGAVDVALGKGMGAAMRKAVGAVAQGVTGAAATAAAGGIAADLAAADLAAADTTLQAAGYMTVRANMRAPIVRQATPDDAPGIVALLGAIAREGSLGVPPGWFDVGRERQLLATVSQNRHLCLVLDAAGSIIGHLLLIRNEAPFAAHTAAVAIALDAAQRGQGQGAALLRGGESWAVAMGIEKLLADVLADNHAALRFFEAHGFLREGLRRGQWKEGGNYRDEVLLGRWVRCD